MTEESPKHPPKTTIVKIILSTLAAFIGIQNDRNREQDFQQKSILPYMISGIFFATVFILSLVLIAKYISKTM